MKLKRFIPLLLLLNLSFAILSLLSGPISLGSGGIRGALSYAFTGIGDETSYSILLVLRLPRVIFALAAGAALAMAGAGFQAIFQNSLADPYVIGSSSGAALGGALAISGMVLSAASSILVSAAAFAGALLAVFLALGISRLAGRAAGGAALLLSGAALNSLFSSLLSLCLLVKDQNMARIYFWLLGSLAGVGWIDAACCIPPMALGCALIALRHRELDLIIQGDASAGSLGVDPGRLRIFIALGASLAGSAVVAGAGIIGFVGLIAPHMARFILGPLHRRLLPASALLGSLLVLLSDLLARSSLPPLEIPLGLITSLLGVPFFIWLLIRNSYGS